MTRMGFFTGKLYDSSVDISTITECCEVLTPYFKEPVLDDDEFVIKKRQELKKNCKGCFGCPTSQMSDLDKSLNDRMFFGQVFDVVLDAER